MHQPSRSEAKAAEFVKWFQDEGHAYYDEMLEPLTRLLDEAFEAGLSYQATSLRVYERIAQLADIVLAARDFHILPTATTSMALNKAILSNHSVVDRLIADNMDETFTVPALRGMRVVSRLLEE